MPTPSMGRGGSRRLTSRVWGTRLVPEFQWGWGSQQVKWLQGQEPAWPRSPWRLGKNQGVVVGQARPREAGKGQASDGPAHLDFWSLVWVSAAHEP